MSSPKIDAKEKPECLEFALGEYCHVLNVEEESYPVHLALGTGRQAVAAATQAHGTPGQTSTRRAPSTRDR